MKKYKAIVIDGKKLIKNVGLAGAAAGICGLLLAAATLSGKTISRAPGLSPESMVENVFPAAGAANNAYTSRKSELKTQFKKALDALLSFDPAAPSSILAGEIPVSCAVNETGAAKLAKAKLPAGQSGGVPAQTTAPTAAPAPEQSDIPPENQAPIKTINACPSKDGSARVVLGNETSYSVNIEEMLAAPPSIDMSKSGPKVLVIHTHATEAYAPENSTIYDITASDRSLDTEKNVVKAGNAICDVLNSKGIETLHDTDLHDHPSFNGSYAHSLAAIDQYLEKYPSIQVVFDIHRDSIVYDDNTKAKVLTEINGKPAAQLMFVVGTDQKGLYNPNWRENIKNAIHFQDAINQKYPTLMRHINLRQERFNAHTTNGSMIIETGSSGNSLSEAVYGLTLAAECIGDYLNSLK